MLENDFTRKDAVVAVGGGVVGDLAGFVAASFMRGVDFYNIPHFFRSWILPSAARPPLICAV